MRIVSRVRLVRHSFDGFIRMCRYPPTPYFRYSQFLLDLLISGWYGADKANLPGDY
jgi:hypothetical protein